MIDKLKHTITEDRNGKPMVTIHNFPGLDCDMYFDELKMLMRELWIIQMQDPDFKDIDEEDCDDTPLPTAQATERSEGGS